MSKPTREEFKTNIKNKLEENYGKSLDSAISQIQGVSLEILATEEFLREKKLNIKFDKVIKNYDESIVDLIQKISTDSERKLSILENLGLDEEDTEKIFDSTYRTISWRMDEVSKKYRLFYTERSCKIAVFYHLDQDSFISKRYFDDDSEEIAKILHDCPIDIRLELFPMLPYFVSSYSDFINGIFERQKTDDLLAHSHLWNPFE